MYSFTRVLLVGLVALALLAGCASDSPAAPAGATSTPAGATAQPGAYPANDGTQQAYPSPAP